MKNGIQVSLREYAFDAKNRLTFFEEDIINIFPVVKHINPRVSITSHELSYSSIFELH